MSIYIKPSHKGLLHKKLGVAQGSPIPAKKLAKAEHSSSPALRKEANFAKNAKSFHHPGHAHASSYNPKLHPSEKPHHARMKAEALGAFDHLKG